MGHTHTHAHTRTYTHTHTHRHRSTHSGSDLNLVRSRRSFKLYDRCCDWLKVKRFPTRADQYEAVLCCTVWRCFVNYYACVQIELYVEFR